MNKNKLRAALAIIAVIALAIGTYLAYDNHARRTHAAALVKDAAQRLQAHVKAQAEGRDHGGEEADATAMEAYASALRDMNTSSFAPLAEAADDYLVTAREIMRRAVNMQVAKTRLALSVDALASHIRGDHGTSEWTHEAVRRKQAVDDDLRPYRIAVESYASLMAGLPVSQAKIAPFVDASVLVQEPVIGAARKRALDAYAAAEQNAKQTADLGAYRGKHHDTGGRGPR